MTFPFASRFRKGEYRFLFSRIGIGINHFGPGIGIGQYLTLSHIGISQLNPIKLTGYQKCPKKAICHHCTGGLAFTLAHILSSKLTSFIACVRSPYNLPAKLNTLSADADVAGQPRN